MANLPENTDNPILRPVTQLEITTKVYGGEYIPDDEEQRGVSNLQAIELAERDQYIISRVGQAAIPASGDIPAEVGIASLDNNGKVPDSQIPSGITRNTNTQTLTNKTISYADNTLTGVVGETATQTLTNKTISYADNTLTGVVGETATQTLTNKTIDAKDNVMLCTATNITSSQTITPTKQMMVTAGMSGITLTLGSGPYAGYALPILAVADCFVSYTGIDGAATETLDVGSYITFIWDDSGSYWVVDAGAFEKPTYISTTQTLTAVKKMIAVVNTSGVVLTLDAGPYDGFELPVLATADCQIVYTGINGSVTKNVQANTYNEFVWGGSYWLPRESTAITGIDDNGQPFAFNIDALTQADGVINLTGTDADGNPFDYGLGKLVVAADENTYSTSEQLTTKTWIDGKPIYRKVFTGTTPTFTTGTVSNTIIDGSFTGDVITIIKACGTIKGADKTDVPIPLVYAGPTNISQMGYVYTNVNGLIFSLWTSDNSVATRYSNKPYFIILEYTKTTD